jgi:hypothetical protein
MYAVTGCGLPSCADALDLPRLMEVEDWKGSWNFPRLFRNTSGYLYFALAYRPLISRIEVLEKEMRQRRHRSPRQKLNNEIKEVTLWVSLAAAIVRFVLTFFHGGK